MGSKKSGKKNYEKNQQTSLLFFHIKNNKNTSDRIEKPCLLYKRKKKTGPHSILHSLKKRNYSSQSKQNCKNFIFFPFSDLSSKNKKDLVSNKIFPLNSQKKNYCPQKKSRFLLQKK